MLGQSAERFFTPEDRLAGVVEREMRDAVQRGRGTDERWHLREDGTRFWASGEMMPLLKDGEILIGYIKILRDRTPEKLREEQLIASDAWLRASQKAGQIGTFEVDLSSGIMSITPEFCTIFGVEEAHTHPPAIFEALVLPEDRHIPSNARTRLGGEAITDVEYRIRRPDGAVRWIARRAEFAYADDGKADRMFGTVQDITQRKRAELKVAALLELGDTLHRASQIGEVIAAASRILGETLGGYRAGYAIIDSHKGTFAVEHVWVTEGADPRSGVHDVRRFGATVRALSSGEVVAVGNIEAAHELADDLRVYGAMATRALIMVPLTRRGELVGVLFVHSDHERDWTSAEINFARNVADRTYAAIGKLQAEAEQALLNQELSHRLKNTLAMVQAIAGQTLKNVTERDAVEALTSRIVALSTAHDILLQDDWSAARLDQVAQGVLALHAQPEQVRLGGPPIPLSPRAGLSVSLLLNELATNAAKYGALSQTGGVVTVTWRVDAQDDLPLLALNWVESGGPVVAKPGHKGFGSRLIRTGLVGTGDSEIAYEPSGLVASFTAPMARLLQD